MMNLYPIVRPLLFALPPEVAHELTLTSLKVFDRLMPLPEKPFKAKAPTRLMGLEFPNPIGLAAGLDKAGRYIDGLRRLGFGFIEIGTFTPKPQGGNPKPRLFRLKDYRALINRMDFNNPGITQALVNIREARSKGILGINIVKNSKTPNDRALPDYLECFDAFYPIADYIAVNVSCPNTPGLRAMQKVETLKPLLLSLKEAQAKNENRQGHYVPLVVKVAPDFSPDEIGAIASLLQETEVDGLIATNTTVARPSYIKDRHANERGGLSGQPLKETSLNIVTNFREALGPKFPIIGVGGITCGQDAADMLKAGANLCQIYTGLIYRGPGLVQECMRAIED